MRGLAYYARADLRTRWRAWAGLALLLGVAGGIALGAASGARRTTTAYPRLLEATDAFDVLVNPNDGQMDFEAVESLPGVAATARGAGLVVAPAGPDGEPVFDFENSVFASLDGRLGFEINRPVVDEGRLPDPARADEVFVASEVAAAEDLHVGSRIPFISFDEAGLAALDEGRRAPGTPVTVTVVGIGTTPDEALTDEEDRLHLILATPAFVNRYRSAPIFEGLMLELDPRTDVDAFVAAAQRATTEKQVFFQTRTDLLDKADRAVRPYWGALTAFALVAGAATLLIVGQALARQLFVDGDGYRLLSALGVTRSELFASAMARIAATVLAGATLAIAVAFAVSPLTPVGSVARDTEPDPGFWWDGAVIVGFAAAASAFLLIVLAWPAWRAARAATRSVAEVPRGGRVRVADALARAGAPPAATTGVAMALAPGTGTSAVPVRATITGATLSVAALVMALVFGASLNHLLDTPRLYGANWDATIDFGGGGEDANMAAADRMLRDDEAVEAYTRGANGQVAVAGRQTPTIGLHDRRGSVPLTLLDGRAPRDETEIVLGRTTLGETGHDVGDEIDVSVGRRSRRMTIVGTAVFPRFAAYGGADKTGLGTGAAVTLRGLRTLVPSAYLSFFMVEFEPGTDVDGKLATFEERILEQEDDEGLTAPAGVPERPQDLVGYEEVDYLPLALAAFLLLLAGGTTSHALVSSVRRRRRDLAVLKTLGFVRRQVSAAVAWQATTVVVLALVIGVPLGIAAGRWGWTELAERAGAVASPAVPALLVLLVVPAAVVAANVVAAIPARSAARTHPAEVLRSE